MYINISATIRNIDPNIYEHLKDQDDINLVLLYEKWCSHSDEVQKIFQRFDNDKQFKQQNIKLAYFDLKNYVDFRKTNNIKSIPKIVLIMHNIEIIYNGDFSYESIFSWLLEKTQLSKIPKIENLEQFNVSIQKEKVFLFNGDDNHPRFKVFAEGFYHYPDQKFYWTDDPYIEQQYNLEENVVYLFEGGKNFKYKKAYKKERYLDWVLLQLKQKYSEVNTNSINTLFKKRNPTLLMVYDNSNQSQQSLDFLKQNYELYYENFVLKFCNISNQNCKKFLNIYKDQIDSYPTLILIRFSKKLTNPIFYEQLDATPDNIQKFIQKATQHKLSQKIFSEDLDNLPQNYNDQVRKVSRNSLSNYFTDNMKRDSIMFFYSSDFQENNDTLQKFIDFSNVIYGNGQNKQKISLAYFDMSKNSCEILKPMNNKLFLRIYRHGVYDRFHDKEINESEIENFQRFMLNFLSDMTTERIDLYDFNDDIQLQFKQI